MMKRGQEEIVGFVIIVVIISVILLIVLGFLLKSPDESAVQNYKIDNFLESTLQYTSDCENYLEFLPVRKLIISCEGEEICLDGRKSCEVLNQTLKNIIKYSWNIGNESAVRGYELRIVIDDSNKLLIEDGNKTLNYKGGMQDFARSGKNYEVYFKIYE